MAGVKYLWSEDYVGKRLAPEIPEEGDRTQPYSDSHWSQVETFPPEKIKEIQWRRLESLIRYAYENSPFYRKKWDEAKVRPSDIKSLEDIVKLPVIRKQDTAQDRLENPPYGTIATSPPHTHAKYLQTSGTTGRPQIWTMPIQDWEDVLEATIRAVYAQGVRKGWRGFFGFGFLPLPGWWAVWEASANLLGIQSVPKGTLPTVPWLDIVRTLAGECPTFYAATPTYAVRTLEVAQSRGIDPKSLKFNLVIVGAEPGYGVPATHKLITEGFNCRLHDEAGATEILGPFMFSCDYLSEPNSPSDHITADYWLMEALDPDTLMPVKANEEGLKTGVACATMLVKYGMPAIRLLINDYMTISENERCGCGRSFPIVKGAVKARGDDMLIVKGTKIYPTLIEESVRSIQGLSPEYRIKRTSAGVTIVAEPLPDLPSSEHPKLAQALQEHIRERALVRLDIEMVPPGTLPREEAKTKRVFQE